MEDDGISDMKTVSDEPPVSGDPMEMSVGDWNTVGADSGEFGVIDRYALKEQLGAGGFGAVYRATDTVVQIDVAVKVLPPMITAVPEELENVRANFALDQKLKHQNIASLEHLHKVEHPDGKAQEAAARVQG